MTGWYGTRPSWRVPFEAAARRRFGTDLHALDRPDLTAGLGSRLASGSGSRSAGRRGAHGGGESLEYRVAAVEVDGQPALVDIAIRFWAEPRYDTYGLAPADFPRVHAEPGVASPHRHIDDALCLWSPFDPPELRWRHELGLLDLIEITRRHLFLERYWRMTGGTRGGVWLLPDAPHGIPAA
ncbi:hypothetical protein [Actinomycetospora straminea]|uniref:Uncharacterized protein n=1 Tax=Actinomycetospora straminea TaxID=663607 RepID=A0ABP9F5E8_9PSEU|nr:hypothetical protein [Actinomycetospora straminea]MDD7936153.1 hypothetical protein [Actinomycetospora straminea]